MWSVGKSETKYLGFTITGRLMYKSTQKEVERQKRKTSKSSFDFSAPMSDKINNSYRLSTESLGSERCSKFLVFRIQHLIIVNSSGLNDCHTSLNFFHSSRKPPGILLGNFRNMEDVIEVESALCSKGKTDYWN